MPRRRLAASLTLLLLASAAAICAPAAFAAAPVRLAVGFAPDARLGAMTPITAELRIDPHIRPAPLTSMTLQYPGSLGITTSGLGLAGCRRPAADFQLVSIDAIGLAGCSANAVMALGDAHAQVRIGTYRFAATAKVTVLAGVYGDDGLGLVAFVDGINPLGYKLAYHGVAGSSPAPFGGQLGITLPTIPDLPDDASFALTRLRLSIGDPRIVYVDRGRRFRPDGIELPRRCPRGGFRFRAELGFDDGSSTKVETRTACPRR
ncbi:hypothetical protein Q5424_20785 [Conexibacter sp. JD483]|uniref:hypothetical protein n=1 Tax=unclassified Conexibacter TaxID=2627773 RepID=UPI00271FA4F1|nr:MULTISPECIES: hypothetical protein [unclassified Conexibacter]MDO8185546.1 hypothetical protein [Conexibacter sp. CPCC 205706]MDO8197267.1 hypothetical protein [Conexibacter sp. CPCC 205762]MDR9371548.1 hypothetical protein [Conexibacter sp. JD483]